MADLLPPQKKQCNVYTFTSIVFITSFLLVLLILPKTQRVNSDLFSHSAITINPSPPIASLPPYPSLAPPPIFRPESTNIEDSTDANFNGRKEEDETGFAAVEENKQLGFIYGSVIDNGSVLGKVDDVKKWGKTCNFYMGKWVKDDEYPVYQPGSCPYVDEAYDCQSNGRTDFEYMKWRWKPDDCDLPR